jgi:tRNA pseudouridine38-40 synthase
VPRTLKLTLEYDGRGFHGWQSQAEDGRRTVQATLEQALSRVAGERAVVQGAGRTDAGVHALGQVASVRLERSSLGPDALRDALNATLPADLAVTAAEEAPDGFHARKDAVGKHYRYLLLARRAPAPLLAGHVWHRRGVLDTAGMAAAGAALVGRHDFSAFRAAAGAARSPVRILSRLTVADDPARHGLVRIDLEANGFLMHMARIIVGTLVEVGRGRIPPSRVGEILAAGRRADAGPTAPAEGLYLVEVRYGGRRPHEDAERRGGAEDVDRDHR